MRTDTTESSVWMSGESSVASEGLADCAQGRGQLFLNGNLIGKLSPSGFRRQIDQLLEPRNWLRIELEGQLASPVQFETVRLEIEG